MAPICVLFMDRKGISCQIMNRNETSEEKIRNQFIHELRIMISNGLLPNCYDDMRYVKELAKKVRSNLFYLDMLNDIHEIIDHQPPNIKIGMWN